MGDNTPRILLIEDDPAIAMGLCDTLEFEGFEVELARTGADGVAASSRSPFDCILLDLMLPDTNGYRVCEKIRLRDSRVPIIMLTARSQEADKIRGLEAGADDYVTKPFSVGELVARIRAIFRRVGRSDASCEPLPIGDVILDPSAQVIRRGRVEIKLSFYEVELLKFLHERKNQPASREEILLKVWGIAAGANNRTVDNLVVKLRKKVEEFPEDPRHILTVYGVGYKLVP